MAAEEDRVASEVDIVPEGGGAVSETLDEMLMRVFHCTEPSEEQIRQWISLQKKYDLILVNPPYLPSDNLHAKDTSIDGGFNGIEVLIQFIPELSKCMAKSGVAFILLSSYSNKDEILKLVSQQQLSIKEKLRKTYGMEDLIIYEIRKT